MSHYEEEKKDDLPAHNIEIIQHKVLSGNPALGTQGGYVWTVSSEPSRDMESDSDDDDHDENDDLYNTDDGSSTCSNQDEKDDYFIEEKVHQSISSSSSSLPQTPRIKTSVAKNIVNKTPPIQSSSTTTEITNNSMVDTNHICAICNVPPDQVPGGVLNLARSHRMFMKHVRILISVESTNTTNKSTIKDGMLNPTVSEDKIEEKDRRTLLSEEEQTNENQHYPIHPSTTSQTQSSPLSIQYPITGNEKAVKPSAPYSSPGKLPVCIPCNNLTSSPPIPPSLLGNKRIHEEPPERTFLVLISFTSAKACQSFVTDLHGKPFTTLQQDITASVYHVWKLKEDTVAASHDRRDTTTSSSPTTMSLNRSRSESWYQFDQEYDQIIPSKSSLSPSSSTSYIHARSRSTVPRVPPFFDMSATSTTTSSSIPSMTDNNTTQQQQAEYESSNYDGISSHPMKSPKASPVKASRYKNDTSNLSSSSSFVPIKSSSERKLDTMADSNDLSSSPLSPPSLYKKKPTKIRHKNASTPSPYPTMETHNCPVCLEKMDLSPMKRRSTSHTSMTSSSSPSPRPSSSPSPRPSPLACYYTNPNDEIAYYNTFHSPSLFTTVCNHTFHMDCILRCQDSPCPVCRYDHSGLNDSTPLSECHECGVIENIYICLICGVASCAGEESSCSLTGTAGVAVVASTSASTLSNVNDSPFEISSKKNNSNNNTPTKKNLLHDANTSSTTNQSISMINHNAVNGHARQHYEETLHAYALNTETQHVWDFVGGGFVHRLIQNYDDGKIVEISDPHSTSQERSLHPPSLLTEAEEEEMVHRKLERFAGQYHSVLKTQLDQQRVYYEGLLECMRREYKISNQEKKRSTADYISALKQDRHQLQQRLLNLQSKVEKTNGDLTFLKDMNESLETNKGLLRQQISQAQSNQRETRAMLKRCLPPLEERVNKLMMQLENDFD